MRNPKAIISALLCIAIGIANVCPADVYGANRMRFITASSTAAEAKESAGDAVSNAKKKAKEAGTKVKKEADKAGKKVKQKADEVGKTAKDVSDKAYEKAKSAGKTASEKAGEAVEEVSNAAANLRKMTSDTASNISNSIKNASENFDDKKFQDGWTYLSTLAGTRYAAYKGLSKYQSYAGPIEDAIEKMRTDLVENTSKTRLADKEKGFVFERWQADTFNIDAAANRSEYQAEWLLPEGEFAKEDVTTNYGEKASMKAYADGAKSASAQSGKKGASILKEGYQKYNQDALSNGNKEISLKDYVDNHLSKDEVEALFEAKYAGQTRIIPADQIADAEAYLKGKIDKLTMPDTYSAAEKKNYQDTLENLRDRLEAPDGTKSKPLTSEELQALTEMAQDGDVDLEKFGVKVSDYISKSELLEEVIGAGAQAAALSVALEIGPDLYTVLVDVLKDGKVDENALKKTGLDAAIAGTSGFAEGSISQFLLVACKSGKFGADLKNVSPDTVGNIAVLTVDAAKYAYRLSRSEISSQDYADLMAEETFVAIASKASGMALQTLLPMVPFAYLAGSMAGGMLASAGYDQGKKVALEVKAAGGLGVIIPEAATQAKNVGKNIVANLDFSDKATELSDLVLTTTKKGQIIVSGLAGN